MRLSRAVLHSTAGFTLIELLVVITIIGILAVTIIPKIMGAPAQGRDTGRVAELNTLSIAMQSYYNDNGAFPTATSVDCLSPTSTVGAALVSGLYLQASNFPKDPTKSSTTGSLCSGTSAGHYAYKSLTKNGIADNAFLLVADVENDKKANANVSCASSTAVDGTSGADTCVAAGVGSATGATAVYIKVGGV